MTDVSEGATTMATIAEPLADLDETPMHDGVTWFADGPRGRTWLIVWQPGRTEDNIRAWPAPGGRTAHWSNATDIEAARTEALRIAELIGQGKKAS